MSMEPTGGFVQVGARRCYFSYLQASAVAQA